MCACVRVFRSTDETTFRFASGNMVSSTEDDDAGPLRSSNIKTSGGHLDKHPTDL